MKILITGGAGFIGCNAADRFLRRRAQVTIFDNLSRRGVNSNLDWLRARHGSTSFQLIQADVRDATALLNAAHDQEVIIHLAAQVTVTTSVTDPRNDFETNAIGTFNALEAARLSGSNPIFLYSSTNKVYGGMDDVVLAEDARRYSYRDYPQGIPETYPLDFHSPYGCCYSADTDILTGEGWKKFYEMSSQEEVLTYNMEKEIAEFQLPTAHFAYPYKGKMFVQNNRRLQTCVTPNHKMLVASGCDHTKLVYPKLVEAQQLSGKPRVYLLAADVEGGKTCDSFILPEVKGGSYKHRFAPRAIPMEDWLKFLGWYIAEGHCYENKKTGNCTVTLTTYYRTQEAVSVMRAVGLSPAVDKHHITATSRQMYDYLKQFGKSHTKYLPLDIKQLTEEYLSILLKALLDGDGNRQSKNSWKYTTVSRQLADDVQEIAIKCGFAASISLDKQGFYRVYICTTRTAQCNLDEDRSTWVDYDGMVYCVEVPNSVVMVRQNGHAYFSGNSKGTGDQYVRDYARIYGLQSVVFRQSSIYGPRQFGIEDQGWLAWFIIAAITGKPITIYGDGKQVRDVLFIDDLIDLYETAIAKIDQSAGQVFNVGGGADNILSIWTDFGPLLEKLLNRKIDVGRGDWRPGDQRIYVSDIRKAEEILGWSPRVNPSDGVKKLFEWVVANRSLFEN